MWMQKKVSSWTGNIWNCMVCAAIRTVPNVEMHCIKSTMKKMLPLLPRWERMRSVWLIIRRLLIFMIWWIDMVSLPGRKFLSLVRVVIRTGDSTTCLLSAKMVKNSWKNWFASTTITHPFVFGDCSTNWKHMVIIRLNISKSWMNWLIRKIRRVRQRLPASCRTIAISVK